jgi:Fe-S oxidoreductase
MRFNVDNGLANEVASFGAKEMDACMQCGTCSASCPLSSGANTFPRKIYRYLQLGLRDKLLESCEPWLCYYCGDCNKDCPRGAEPAETMMATRRWLTAQYDWTGLAKRFYLSEKWEFGALIAVALGIVALFFFGHGPVITDRVSVNTFAPVLWVEIGDLTMAVLLFGLLMSNAYRMYRRVMRSTKAPFWLYITEAKSFIGHFLTQKRWRRCGEDSSRWLKHFLLVTGYLTMMMLVIVFIRWFQVDDSSWHFTSIFGYYATGVLLFITVEMFLSRRRKEEAIHRYSELSDWLFLILLFLTALTGIMMHTVRLLGWPVTTYVMYVVHLAIAVPMLVVEVPFGKWSHLMYRPLAIYLAAVKEKASKPSEVNLEVLKEEAGDLFITCMQCGTCTSLCPQSSTTTYSPRRILRELTMDSATVETVDRGVWRCVTCNACVTHCPRGIDIIGLVTAVRSATAESGYLPNVLKGPLNSLKQNGNPWNGTPEEREAWNVTLEVPIFEKKHEYALFTCCTTAFDPDNREVGPALTRLLKSAGVSFGVLSDETCCGDLASRAGDNQLFEDLVQKNGERFRRLGVKKLLTTSPHCLDVFRKRYPLLNEIVQSLHYTELLYDLIDKERLLPTGRIDRTVTYHDPCYLGRHNDIYEAPRRVLERIPGITLKEMASNREESLCCGGGGGGAWLDAGDVANRRIREALDTGADIIATACPYCIRMLNQAVKNLGVQNRIVVKDVAELLSQSVEMTAGVDIVRNKPSDIALERNHA